MKKKQPKTLIEAVRRFDSIDAAHDYLKNLRWPEGVIGCPTCGCSETYYLKTVRRWKCKACHRQFSVKVGTIFEDSPIGLDKWLVAVWLITNAKNGISSCEISRGLGVTQKTAWFMLHRIRFALRSGSLDIMLSGQVEADETYIGGKAKNMHPAKRKARGGFGGPSGKTPVHGMIQRGGPVVASVITQADRPTLDQKVKKHVHPYATLFTDQHTAYEPLKFYYQHHAVNHAQEFVRGNVHTNSIENFWSLLKRTLGGTYVAVSPDHLHRYLSEQVFRFNERKGNDGDRFDTACSLVSGLRLTYKELIGHTMKA